MKQLMASFFFKLWTFMKAMVNLSINQTFLLLAFVSQERHIDVILLLLYVIAPSAF